MVLAFLWKKDIRKLSEIIVVLNLVCKKKKKKNSNLREDATGYIM